MLFLSAAGLYAEAGAEELNDFVSFSFIDNKVIDTSKMRGEILVLLFGSIYCKPCVELLPVMRELKERYQDSDLRIILLDIDMAVDQELQQEFVRHHAINSPYIINALPIARNNKVYMLPTTLIVDRQGSVVKRIYGFKKSHKFESVIKKLRPIIKGPKDLDAITTKALAPDNATVPVSGGLDMDNRTGHHEDHH